MAQDYLPKLFQSPLPERRTNTADDQTSVDLQPLADVVKLVQQLQGQAVKAELTATAQQQRNAQFFRDKYQLMDLLRQRLPVTVEASPYDDDIVAITGPSSNLTTAEDINTSTDTSTFKSTVKSTDSLNNNATNKATNKSTQTSTAITEPADTNPQDATDDGLWQQPLYHLLVAHNPELLALLQQGPTLASSASHSLDVIETALLLVIEEMNRKLKFASRTTVAKPFVQILQQTDATKPSNEAETAPKRTGRKSAAMKAQEMRDNLAKVKDRYQELKNAWTDEERMQRIETLREAIRQAEQAIKRPKGD